MTFTSTKEIPTIQAIINVACTHAGLYMEERADKYGAELLDANLYIEEESVYEVAIERTAAQLFETQDEYMQDYVNDEQNRHIEEEVKKFFRAHIQAILLEIADDVRSQLDEEEMKRESYYY